MHHQAMPGLLQAVKDRLPGSLTYKGYNKENNKFSTGPIIKNYSN